MKELTFYKPGQTRFMLPQGFEFIVPERQIMVSYEGLESTNYELELQLILFRIEQAIDYRCEMARQFLDIRCDILQLKYGQLEYMVTIQADELQLYQDIVYRPMDEFAFDGRKVLDYTVDEFGQWETPNRFNRRFHRFYPSMSYYKKKPTS